MKIFSPRTLLAAALLTALPMGSALACTTSAWSSVTGSAEAGNPKGRDGEPAVPRYSGTCGLQAASAGASYVTDNSPGAEAIYRARFYVFTGSAANNPKIFSATTEDDNGGTEVVGIALNGSAMAFTVNGTTVSSTVPVAASKWYGVEIAYAANGPFEAKVRGANAAAETVVASAGNAGALTVGSASLGVLNAAANTIPLAFDAFESTRSADTEIGRLCPGDANNDGLVNSGDALAAINEFPPSGSYSLGQPDCTEDGLVNAGDALCAMNRFTVPTQRSCSAN
ncbi:dockerin type I domain-containing protein [Denitratimonas sp. CY0512]|uniref:dockerin type I domain-containing protein n=1 Tax=Denitratimonas sp. CY0512 TaxID=3131940 RepID=UPI0030A4C7A6